MPPRAKILLRTRYIQVPDKMADLPGGQSIGSALMCEAARKSVRGALEQGATFRQEDHLPLALALNRNFLRKFFWEDDCGLHSHGMDWS
jgi:hypothetical protein